MGGTLYDVELWLGRQGLTSDSVENAERVHTAKNMPLPARGDFVHGRTEQGAQFIGLVLWVQHFYETRTVRVYMRHA